MAKHLFKIVVNLLCIYCVLGQTDNSNFTSVNASCPECFLEKINQLEAKQKSNKESLTKCVTEMEKMMSRLAEIEKKTSESEENLKRLIIQKSCKPYNVIPSNYIYKNFYTLDDRALRHTILKKTEDKVTYFEIHIAIKAEHSAVILLSPVSIPSQENDNFVFEIGIGTSANQKTLVATSLTSAPPVKTARTPNVLSPDRFEYFYIKISDCTLTIGKEGESTPLITYNDSHVSTINYFSFTHWSDKEAEFLIDCLPSTAFS